MGGCFHVFFYVYLYMMVVTCQVNDRCLRTFSLPSTYAGRPLKNVHSVRFHVYLKATSHKVVTKKLPVNDKNYIWLFYIKSRRPESVIRNINKKVRLITFWWNKVVRHKQSSAIRFRSLLWQLTEPKPQNTTVIIRWTKPSTMHNFVRL